MEQLDDAALLGLKSLSMGSKRHPETSHHSYNIAPFHDPKEQHQFHCGKALTSQ
jgi:hypothetical protein